MTIDNRDESIIIAGINTLQQAVHRTAVEHGWWEDGERNMGEMIALMHSELSEALESYRDSEPYLHYKYPGMAAARYHSDSEIGGVLGKPEGIASEFADTIIRIADTCEKLGIPLAQALIEKAQYNETRPYRHGGKKA